VKIAVITCYKQPDYIRAVTLRAATTALPGSEVIIIKNNQLGALRYPEVVLKSLWLRLCHRPDVYVLTFRCLEILPMLAVTTWPKPIIYDEMISPLEWLNEPGREQKFSPPLKALMVWSYRQLLKRCKFVLADTAVHADYSARLSGLARERFVSLPVSTNEQLFRSGKKAAHKPFRVFYYGNMLPLHGLAYVLEAAIKLKDLPIEFRISGGQQEVGKAVQEARENGAQISYETWTPFDQLPKEISLADICLGGPFGKTTQANLVITGKTYQFMASGAATIIGKNAVKAGFRDKDNCLLVPLGDSIALVAAITWAYEHPEQLPIIGGKGHKLYEADFSQARLGEQVRQLFDRL
jgi:glycosyltransferase involved in cell wall biosynthesis